MIKTQISKWKDFLESSGCAPYNYSIPIKKGAKVPARLREEDKVLKEAEISWFVLRLQKEATK